MAKHAAPGSGTLKLTLKREWFDLVVSGKKKTEYRDPSDWILSRLSDKTYDRVSFRNGYSATSPVVVCEYKGWKYNVKSGLVEIKLGRVLESPKPAP